MCALALPPVFVMRCRRKAACDAFATPFVLCSSASLCFVNTGARPRSLEEVWNEAAGVVGDHRRGFPDAHAGRDAVDHPAADYRVRVVGRRHQLLEHEALLTVIARGLDDPL